MTQIELGYRFAEDFIEFCEEKHPEAIHSDDRLNGGRCVVLNGITVPGAFPKPAALLVYICEDAQAWGTFTVHETLQDAEKHSIEIMATLQG